MEFLIIGLFCAALLLCVILDFSILYALAFGLFIFMLYGRHKGFSLRQLIRMALEGILTVKNILITFLLIGVLTALWRAAGTIPVIVLYASDLIAPPVFLLMAFLLNCGLSILTGTSFGTAATMGVICAAIGTAMDASPVLTGGAILSGVYFGDRCSPVSTSALLVSAITGTDIYANIRRMLKSALIPFILTCAIYLILGLVFHDEGTAPDLEALFSRAFRLSPAALIPAALILLLAAFHVNVKAAMTASILAAIPVCLAVQGMSVPEILQTAVTGFRPGDAEVSALVSGGGLISMVRTTAIVCLSSSYSCIFEKTGLLDGLKEKVTAVSAKTTAFTAIFLTSILSSMIACNQTLSILLTDQLCKHEYSDSSQLALDLEDTAVIIAPLVPWSIAGVVPLTMTGSPLTALLTSFYLIILPLYRLAKAHAGKGRKMRGQV